MVMLCLQTSRHRCPSALHHRLVTSTPPQPPLLNHHVYSSDPEQPQGDLRTTNRQPSTDAPAMVGHWWRRQNRDIKKLIFSAPSKCPIDRFGPLANRTTFKQL
jgi:hypothetical protein